MPVPIESRIKAQITPPGIIDNTANPRSTYTRIVNPRQIQNNRIVQAWLNFCTTVF